MCLCPVALGAVCAQAQQKRCTAAEVTIAPSTFNALRPGQDFPLTAVVFDSSGNPCNPSGGVLSWKTGDVHVASITANGIVRAIAPGTTIITLLFYSNREERVARVPVTVASETLTPVPGSPSPSGSPAMTAGFGIPAYDGRSEADQLEYARTLALLADSAMRALVEVFRNTSGTPLVGATSPNVLSLREKRRWSQCRLIQIDLETLAEAVNRMENVLSSRSALQRSLADYSQAFEGLGAPTECNNITSMISSPERWAPWDYNYDRSVRSFFKVWYPQLRAAHEANRVFVRALNAVLPAERQLAVPPGLPPTAPTIGAVR